jgi:hypothetical protein
MEKIKVTVKSVIKFPDAIGLAPVKDTKVSEDLTLKKDVLFYSVPVWTWEKMNKNKTVLVWIVNGRLFAKPDL